ncbi:MAG: aminotransferase class III-fold pyridoxal phosphate-dependent enzyme, partial [Thermodesulfobacteriota bacterium]
GRDLPSCGLECADELEKTILYEGPDSVSAFIAEPVVGATAGALVPPDGYFQKIREICNRYDMLLIVDEVMSGVGRTGKYFAVDHWGVVPDILVGSKGLASGYTPIYCVVTKQNIHTTIREGNGTFVHGHTYSQNPLSCSIASAVLDYIRKHGLVERCAVMGNYLLNKLHHLYRHRIVGDVRGLGLMAGVEFVKNRDTKEPFDPKLKINTRIGNRAFENGLITYPGGGGADGIRGDHILLAPPFIITEAQIDELVRILDEAVAEIATELGV